MARMWDVEVPPEPTDVPTLWDVEGDAWQRNAERAAWMLVGEPNEPGRTWAELLIGHGPVTDEPPSDGPELVGGAG